VSGLGFTGKRRHEFGFESFCPVGPLTQRIDRGDGLGVAGITAADIAETHLATVEAHRGASDRHFTGAEGRAGAGDAALHHDQPDLGAAQDDIGGSGPERLPQGLQPCAWCFREDGKPSAAALD